MESLFFVTNFFSTIEKKGIRYVHWKSNLNLQNALMGDDDLDILVHPEDKTLLEGVFRDLNIIRGYSEKDAWQEGVCHYYGLDEETIQIVHIHLHYALPVGYDYNKNFSLPIVDEVLTTKVQLHNVFVSCPEYEYIILVFRILIKNAFTPFLLSSPVTQFKLFNKSKKIDGNALKEFEELKNKVNRHVLKEYLGKSKLGVSFDFFGQCEKVVSENNSILALFKTSKQLKKKLKFCRSDNEIKSFFISFYRLNKNRLKGVLNKFFKNTYRGTKTPEFGGRIFAFIGGDGAGKSTNISKLKKNLSKNFKTISLHIGKPPKSILGGLLYYSSRLLRLIKLKSISKNLMYLRLAIDRKKAFQKALKFRKKGMIVILDRIPLKEITAMDAPRINPKKYPILSKFEKKQYKNIKGIDLLFIMKLNPETAIQRRPEDNPDQLKIRSGQVWDNEWSSSYQFLTDTGELNFEEVERRILSKVWSNLIEPYKFIEFIGVSGSGKSTLIKKCSSFNDNFITKFSYKNNVKALVISSLLMPLGLLSILKPSSVISEKRLMFSIKFHELLDELKIKNKKDLDKNFFLDQSIVFLLVMCYKEGFYTKYQFIKKANELADLFDKVIYLNAPKEILFKRIKNRKNQGIGRAKDMTFEEFKAFYEEYERAFMTLKETKLNIVYIDSTAYTPKQILEIANS